MCDLGVDKQNYVRDYDEMRHFELEHLYRYVSAVDTSQLCEDVPTAPPLSGRPLQRGATVEHQENHALVSAAWP